MNATFFLISPKSLDINISTVYIIETTYGHVYSLKPYIPLSIPQILKHKRL